MKDSNMACRTLNNLQTRGKTKQGKCDITHIIYQWTRCVKNPMDELHLFKTSEPKETLPFSVISVPPGS